MSKMVLVAITSCDRYAGSGKPTGLWLGELVHFLDEVETVATCTLVSPRGGKVPLDPASEKGFAVDASIRAFQADPTKMERLAHTQPTAEIDPAGYDAIYYTGGHGTMWDFPGDAPLQAAARSIFERGGLVAAVCHGVSGLIDVTLSGGEPLVKGRHLTGYSDREELFGGTRKDVPYSLEDRLRERGALYSRSFVPFVSNTKSDGRLLTGQNPFSTRALAKLVRSALG